MSSIDNLDLLFVITAFLFQLVLIVHFAFRKWRFNVAIRYGPIVYALSLLAVMVNVFLLLGGKSWSLWLAGFLYLVWGVFGYWIEYVKKIEWRDPIRWSVFGPYLLLYLATVLFYWFSLALIWKPLWYFYAVLFIVSTILNVTSHKRPSEK
jgi:hypothetical protein